MNKRKWTELSVKDKIKALETEKNKAYFWSGTGDSGKRAADIASKKGGKTLELKLNESNIEMPSYVNENGTISKEGKVAWSEASKIFATIASGYVYFVEGKTYNSEKDCLYNKIEHPVLFNNENVSNINHIDAVSGKLTKVETFSRLNEKYLNEINGLKEKYYDDLIKNSPCPQTINKINIKSEYKKQSSQSCARKREEFQQKKSGLIWEWEKYYNLKWPKYAEDVYLDGVLIRKAGLNFDAHHIQPLTFGGKNTMLNITPIHALKHYDRQGIHAFNSSYDKLDKKLQMQHLEKKPQKIQQTRKNIGIEMSL